MSTVRVLCIGDIVGNPGRTVFQKHIGRLRDELDIDAVIVNGENSSSIGRGITSRIVKFFRHNGVDVVTSGNHIWRNKEIYSYLQSNNDLLRPANYPSSCPGVGVTTFIANNVTIGVINIQGQTFMQDDVDSPFKTAESLLTYLKSKTNVIIVDFHAEASSEKRAFAEYLNGHVSFVFGTHTHVQTADERILPGGTAFITDLGMTGAYNSCIGMKAEPVLRKFLTQMPTRFEVETAGPMILCGAYVEIDSKTGKALSIKRVQVIDNDIIVDSGESDSDE